MNDVVSTVLATIPFSRLVSLVGVMVVLIVVMMIEKVIGLPLVSSMVVAMWAGQAAVTTRHVIIVISALVLATLYGLPVALFFVLLWVMHLIWLLPQMQISAFFKVLVLDSLIGAVVLLSVGMTITPRLLVYSFLQVLLVIIWGGDVRVSFTPSWLRR